MSRKPPIGLSELEKKISDAGRYVVPSDNLRPKILEAAREQNADLRTSRIMLRLSFGAFLIAIVIIAFLHRLDSIREAKPVYSSESLQQRASEIAAEKHVGLDWGLFEAYQEVRSEQANQFGHRNELGTFVPSL